MRPLSRGDIESLLRAAGSAPSMHNTQPWRFRFAGSVIELYRDRSRELPAEDPDGRMLHLSLGAALLNLRVGAAHLGYGSEVRSVLDPARPDLVAELELLPVEAESVQLNQLTPYLTERRTNRHPYLDRPVPDRLRELLERTARLEQTVLHWVDQPSRLRWLQLATADAAEEDDHDAARSAERRQWVGGVRTDNGVPLQSLGPLGSDATAPVRNLAATPADNLRPVARFEPHPQLAILLTRRDGPAVWLRAGQAMERVLLEATAHGLSTSLLNQAIEHEELRRLVHEPVGAWTRPQAVIRFGYGPPVPPTPRRPIADLLLPDIPPGPDSGPVPPSADDRDRAVGVVQNGLADGSEQEPGETTPAS
jgi:nitroreductase